jgi:general stress protein 26
MERSIINMGKSLNTNDQEVLKQAYYFLNKQPAAVLATVNQDKSPHLTVVYFHVDQDMSVSFLTKSDTRKSKNIKKRKKAALLAYDSKTQQSITISGKAKEIDSVQEGTKVFTEALQTALRTSEGGKMPLSQLLSAGRYALYKIAPEQIEFSSYMDRG